VDKEIIITIKTLFVAAAIVFGVWLLVQIKEVIILLFVSLMVALALDPLVQKLAQRRFPRSLSVILIMILLVAVIGGLVTLLITPIVSQTQLFIEQFPRLIETVVKNGAIDSVVKNIGQTLGQQIASASGGLIKVTIDVFTGVASLVSILAFASYMLIDLNNIKTSFLGLFNSKQRQLTKETLDEIERRLGSWVRGQLILMILVGVGVFIGLTILGIPYAVPLAVIAGILELVPLIGPILSAVPAVIVGFAASPVLGLGVIGLFILIQQLENNLIVPKVMQRAVGFNPLVTMLAILIGGRLLGIAGALLAVPVTLLGVIIVRNTLTYKPS